MIRKNVHITKRRDGKWQVKSEGSSRAYRTARTQAEAIKIGLKVTSINGGELITHRPDGRIRAKDSHGHDPFPPRG